MAEPAGKQADSGAGPDPDPAQRQRLIAQASHDLRQSLQAAAIQAHALTLHAHRQSAPGLAALGDQIQDALAHCQAQLDALLALASLGRGAAPETADCSTTVNLSALLAAVAQAWFAAAAEQGLALTVQVTCHPVWAPCRDISALRRILDNLVANAVRHSRGDQLTLEVAVAAAPAGPGTPATGAPVIRVTDNGVGMTEAGMRRTGLGLASARQLSQRLGLDLRLRSRPGAGCDFSLCWPSKAGPIEPD